MSFGRLIYERIEKAATRHLKPAPIAIHAMHPPDVAQSLFGHGKSYSPAIKISVTNRKT
jgi:hypothetical protein